MKKDVLQNRIIIIVLIGQVIGFYIAYRYFFPAVLSSLGLVVDVIEAIMAWMLAKSRGRV